MASISLFLEMQLSIIASYFPYEYSSWNLTQSLISMHDKYVSFSSKHLAVSRRQTDKRLSVVNTDIMNFYNLVSQSSRKHWQHLCRGLRLPTPVSVLVMTHKYLIVRFQSWSFGECGVSLHCHLPGLLWPGVLSMGQTGLFDHLNCVETND